MTTTDGSDVPHDIATGEADEVGADVPVTDEEILPVLDHGECPLCETQFDDPDVFRDHLGEVHGLFDEEGATSVFTLPSVVTIESPEPDIPILPLGLSPTAARTAPPQKFPVALAVFVLLLILVGCGLVYFTRSSSDSTLAADDTRGQSEGPLATTVSPSGLPGSEITVAPDGGGVAGTTDQTSATGGAAPRAGSTTASAPTTSPAPTTTAPPATVPPATFAAPATSGAAVDSCSRDHGQWVVTYSWQFVGGTEWSPLAAYTSLGGGRYQDTVKVPPNGSAQITKVQVTDSSGTRHDVALTPALSTSGC